MNAIAQLVTRRRRLVLVGWAALFVVGMVVGSGVFGKLSESGGSDSQESVRGLEVLDEASSEGLSLTAVVDEDALDTPEQSLDSVVQELREQPWVLSAASRLDTDDPALISEDGTKSVVVITTSDIEDAKEASERVDVARDVFAMSMPADAVILGGDLAVMADQMESAAEDLVRGELVALPLLLVVLLLIFRGVRAALLPVIGALVTVAGALLLLLAATGVMEVSTYAADVVALFGLGLAVDYSLLMVSRFREERGAGHDVPDAVHRTVVTAGRTVLFSALTVAVALSGLFAFGTPVFTSLALGGIATVAVAMLAGITLIPALLGTWGHRIKAARRATADDGFFGRLARRVQGRPLLVGAGVTALLLLAAVPFLDVTYSNGDARVLPDSMQSRQVMDTLQDEFAAASTSPVTVVMEMSPQDPQVAEYVASLESGVEHVADVQVVDGLGDEVTAVEVTPTGTAQGQDATTLVEDLRAARPESTSYVTGQAALLVDFKDQIVDRLPLAALIIGLATFVLLFLMTGSVVLPIKALIMNTLSLGATFGALVWVFQQGHLSGLIGFEPYGAVELWVPIVVFVFAFGLSMDYEVFLLSRIKECYDDCGDNDSAVANGLQRSGKIITSAALLITIVFLGFATGSNLGIKQMGLALAIAVIVDATLVRCLLVPATMTTFGRWNWWAPPVLRRFHDRFGLRESAAVEPAQVERVPELV